MLETLKIRRVASRWLAAGVALTLLTGAPAVATPAKPARAEADAQAIRVRAGERFKLREFDAAGKRFMQAYGKAGKPALVYNAARAFEEAGKAGDAAGLFRLYISITEDADGIVDARERIKRLEGNGASAASAEQSAASAETGTAAASRPGVREARPAATVTSATPTDPGATLHWTVTGVAATGMVAGAVLMAGGSAPSHEANEMAVGHAGDI